MSLTPFSYNTLQETKRSTHQWLDKRTNQPVKATTKSICADTGALLLDSQIKYAFNYGGHKVMFEKEELNKIKALDRPGTTVIVAGDLAHFFSLM